jgi:hypothetical protein
MGTSHKIHNTDVRTLLKFTIEAAYFWGPKITVHDLIINYHETNNCASKTHPPTIYD